MTISFIHNVAVEGLFPFDYCEDYEHHVPNSNVEAAIAMTPMEHLYFTSDNLEYYPHDWTPYRSNHRNDLLSNSSQSFIDSLLDESPENLVRVFSPLKNSVCRWDTKGNPSMKGHCDIPTVHPVKFDEYCDFISQRGHDFARMVTKTTHNDATAEMTKPTTKAAKKKAPTRKARTIGKSGSTKLKVKFGKVSVRSIPRVPMNSIINRKKSSSK